MSHLFWQLTRLSSRRVKLVLVIALSLHSNSNWHRGGTQTYLKKKQCHLLNIPFFHSLKNYTWKERMNAAHSNILFHILYLKKFLSFKLQFKFLLFLKVFPDCFLLPTNLPPSKSQSSTLFILFVQSALLGPIFALVAFCTACSLIFTCLNLLLGYMFLEDKFWIQFSWIPIFYHNTLQTAIT